MWTPQDMAVFNQYLVQEMQGLQPMLPMPLMSGTPQNMLAGPWAHLRPPEPQDASNGINIDDDSDNDNDEDANSEENRTLFCANLDDRITEEMLYEVFLQAGPIETVRIPKDATGKQRTFGFVTYLHASAAPYAMHLYQGLELFRKRVIVKYLGTDKLPQIRTRLPYDLESQFGNRTNIQDITPTANSMSRLSNDMLINPFAQDVRQIIDDGKSRHGRHSYNDAKPYDRNGPRRRSDNVTDRSHERGNRNNQRHHSNHHHASSRRSEQRNNHRRSFI